MSRHSLAHFLDNFFHITTQKSSIKTEILAGLTTFLTMSYIIIVNPQVLGLTGMDTGSVFVATCIAAAIGCFMMGIVANYPIALAPGMGLNAYFAFGVVLNANHPVSWQVALAAVFISGLLFFVLSFLRIREAIVNAMPMSLKISITAGIGLLLAFIALKNSGIITGSPATLIQLGDINAPSALLTMLGFLLIVVLDYYRIRGSIIISILTITGISSLLGLTHIDHIFGQIPSLAPTFMQMDFNGLFTTGMITAIFVFLLVDLFDSTGTLVGVSYRAGLLEKGKLPRLKKALMADSTAIVCGAVLGTSSTTPYIESAAGVSAGGRTGLTAVVVGILILLCLWLSPLIMNIPTYATAPALLYVGVMMLKGLIEIDWNDITEATPAFLTMIFMPFAVSIADGIAMGFISYALIKLLCRRTHEVPYMVWIIAALWATKLWFLGG